MRPVLTGLGLLAAAALSFATSAADAAPRGGFAGPGAPARSAFRHPGARPAGLARHGGQWGRAGLGRRAGFTGRHGRGGFNAFGFGSGPYGSGPYGFGSGPYAYGFGAAGYAFGSSGPGPAPFRAASWPLGDVPGLPVAAGIPAPPVQPPAIYVIGSERRGPARMRRGGVGGPVTAVSGQQGGSGVVVVGPRRTAVR